MTLTLGAIPPARLKLASGLFNLMRNLGGAIGIAGCGTLLNDRTNLHFLRLGEHLNATNPALGGILRRAAVSDFMVNGSAVQAGTQALQQLRFLVLREARTETFADTFLVIMVCFVIATVLVPLLKKAAVVAAPTSDAH